MKKNKNEPAPLTTDAKVLLADSSLFLWGKCRPNTGKTGRQLWHLFKQYKKPEIKAFERRTWKEGNYYSYCPAEYWQENIQEQTNETPKRTDVCVICWRGAKKVNFR